MLSEYEQQQKWRGWEHYFNYIPMATSDSIIDLGCSVGTVSHELAGRVKKVVGIDSNPEFIEFCRARKNSNETFIVSNFESVEYSSLGNINGVWASFSLSYLKHPQRFLASLYSVMSDDAWIALLDISCFISGNLSTESRYYKRVRQFELASSLSGIYDFDFGSKMVALLQSAGFEIIHSDNDVTDPELNFSGAATAEVFIGWQARLSRMEKLSRELGEDYPHFCEELLSNLKDKAHEKRGNVCFVVARKAKR